MNMTGRPSSYIAQEWSVHAQLTISHHRPEVEVTPATPQPDNGVHMEYSWNTIPTTTSGTSPRPCYGFQRGNIIFTTRPSNASVHPSQEFRDSGYGGEEGHPGVYGSLPSRRPTEVYNRRCKSTCSITLSTEHLDEPSKASVSRSHSLNPPAAHAGVSPVQESCEVCGGERSPSSVRRASNYTTHFCTRVPDKTPVKLSQDVASQTHDSEAEASVKNEDPVKSSGLKSDEPLQPETSGKEGETPAADLLQIPPSDVPETEEETPARKPVKRLIRSPARLSGKAPKVSSRKSSSHSPDSALKPQGHKPRTVHIDVYCTGSDASDSSSSSSSDSDAGASRSSPQTVFESDKVRVVHTRAGKDRLPLALLQSAGGSEARQSQSLKVTSSKEDTSTRGYDSDDGLSSHYPSQFSSCTSFQDSNTSRDPSSSTISSSSCALSDSFASSTATSWKDTVTDIESLLHSNLSLARSDSFDYADSVDRLRIKERERAWATKEGSKTWRSPQSERKHMIQQQKLQEFVEKQMSQGSFPLWKAGKSDESEDDGDETGDAWSFGAGSSSKVCTLKREDTVRKATPSTLTTQPPPQEDCVKDTSKGLICPPADFDSLSDTSPHVPLRHAYFPFISRSPSPMPSKVESSIASPFTARVGLRTDQLSKAEKFGTIVGAFRKPGHHIGPSKNPDCTCAHCRNYYFEQNECRSRTRSLDMSLEAAENWKSQLQKQIAEKKNATLRGKSAGNAEELRNYEDQWDDSNAV